jgi:hypothetical protein
MSAQDFSYTVTTERMDFRTLGVLYAEPTRKLSMLFEESSGTNGSWIATTDLMHWQTGETLTDSERQVVMARLNDWGKAQGWRFDAGTKLLDVRLEDVPPDRRESIREMQEAARRQVEEREKIYGHKK